MCIIPREYDYFHKFQFAITLKLILKEYNYFHKFQFAVTLKLLLRSSKSKHCYKENLIGIPMILQINFFVEVFPQKVDDI